MPGCRLVGLRQLGVCCLQASFCGISSGLGLDDSLRLLLQQELGLFIFLDLLLGPSALAARLEELGGHTFVGYRIIRRK